MQEIKVIDIEVSESVVKVADWAGFKYREVLAAAETGDQTSIKKFLEFSGTVDGVDALKHAVTCLELIPVANDFNFSMACHTLKPALQKTLLERLMLAQSRTKKVDLRDSMTHWASSTWGVLNGGEPVCNCDHKADGTLRYVDPNAPVEEVHSLTPTMAPDVAPTGGH